MEKFIVDTNIIIHFVRESALWDFVKKKYFKKGIKSNGYISQVTLGEIMAFAYENRWGLKKRKLLAEALTQFQPIPISSDGVIDAYAQISSFSRNRHKSLKLPKGTTAKDMGKNDLWIASTSSSKKFPLITTDKDFNHLNKIFIEVKFIDVISITSPP